MKRMIAATVGLAFLTVLTGVAFAQELKEDDPIIIEQKEKRKEAEDTDKRYKATLQKTRKDTPAERIDPWSNMRGADDSKARR